MPAGDVEGGGDGSPVVVRGLVKTYAGRNVVDHIDLTVPAGRVYGFLGPNGAGKSTTIDILVGTRPRSGGEVTVLGEDPARDRAAWRARIGVVPQTTPAFVEATVREVVSEFAAFYPNPLVPDEVIEMVGLAGKANARTESLSGGQKRRLDIAVGVIGDPDLIFLDEPTTGLDPVARREAWDLVRYFGERGTTTILTTHYLDEVEALADRAAILINGKIVEEGPVADLGSRSEAPTIVSFRIPDELAGHLNGLGEQNGLGDPDPRGVVRCETREPSRLTYTLLTWAREHGVVELPELRVVTPTLEEVYVSLVHEHDVTPVRPA